MYLLWNILTWIFFQHRLRFLTLWSPAGRIVLNVLYEMHNLPSWYFSPLSLASSYPQSSLMPDHGETLWNCSSQNCRIFYFLFFMFVFFSLVFSFFVHSADFRLLLCVKLLCMFPMFTGSLMHIPAQRFALVRFRCSTWASWGLMGTLWLWRSGSGDVFPDQTLFLCWWVKCSLFFSPPGFQINLSGLPQSKPSLLNRVCPLCSRLGKPVLCPDTNLSSRGLC